MDKKTIGILVSSLLIGIPVALRIYQWAYYRLYCLGYGINKKDKQGSTFLINAVDAVDKKFITDLLKNKVDINLPDASGRTALMHAFIKGDKETINLLLSHGAAINTTDDHGESLLIWYLDAKQFDMVKMLLQIGADPNMGRKYGKPPIIIAQEKGYHELVTLFLQKNARINETDNEGHTFFHYLPLQDNPNDVKNYDNLIKLYKGGYYSGISDDVSHFIMYFNQLKDYATLKKLFVEIGKNNIDIVKHIIGFPGMINELINDRDILPVIQHDFSEHYSISDKIILLKEFPELFKPLLNELQLNRIFHVIEEGLISNIELEKFLNALKELGFAVDVEKRKCALCGGAGEFSDYSRPLDNDCYSYPCSCFEGHQIKILIKQNGNAVMEYTSKNFNNQNQ
jgi:hypothetical protein